MMKKEVGASMTRKHGWAEQVYSRKQISSYEDIIAALQAEHARSLRIVKRLVALAHKEHELDVLVGYEQACADMLNELQKGRT